MKWVPGRRRLLAMDSTAPAKITDVKMHERYTSPLALTKWLYNALKSAKYHLP